MKRRRFLGKVLAYASGVYLGVGLVRAETFLSLEQARQLLWPNEKGFEEMTIKLSKEQAQAITKASGVRVRFPEFKAWKSAARQWLVLDKVIGKHEHIDLAVAISSEGKIQGLEVLTYRETYGAQIRESKWRAQFLGKSHHDRLRLGREIHNITGATLSCSHVTDGINRLTQTWALVLSHL